ncbi:MAG: hypothetical protein HY781_06705 [Chloroflexi bacterium]|nr:hypothetical protein [Chloroflexota bacterium]
MAYKPVSRYRVAYFKSGPKAGKTDIVVVLEDGELYTFEALPPDAAHHLVDLLRNEKPIWLDLDTGTLAVADEPVGAGE